MEDSERQPWFKFYPDDFLAGTLDWDNERVGAYIRLLALSWSRNGVVAESMRLWAGGKEVESVLAEKFVQGEDGRWRHPKLERLREEAGSHKKQAKKAAKARWGSVSNANAMLGDTGEQCSSYADEQCMSNAEGHDVSNAQAMLTESTEHCHPEPEPEPEPEKIKNIVSRKRETHPNSQGEQGERTSSLHLYIVECWNAAAKKNPHGVALVRSVSKVRKDKLRKRLKEKAWPWRLALKKLETVQPIGKNDWLPTFDWLLENDNNAVKLSEGNYDARSDGLEF